MIILGIDPGTARIGWGVITIVQSHLNVVGYGLIETEKNDTPQKRLAIIYDAMCRIIKKYHPDAISIEDLFFAANAKTAIRVGEARGVLLLATAKLRIPVVSYAPLAVKRAICGYGHADKKQMQIMVTRTLKLQKPPEPDDAADALALALTHAFCYKMKTQTTI